MEQDGSTNSIRIDTTQLGDRELQLLETLRRGEPVTRKVNDGHNERLTSQSLRALRLRMEEACCLKMRILARVSPRGKEKAIDERTRSTWHSTSRSA